LHDIAWPPLVKSLGVHILLLNLYYPPDTSATAKMAATVVEALAARHQVTVLCGRPSYDPSERHPWYLYRREEHGHVTVLRTGSTDFARFQMKQRVLNYLTYVALAVPRALFISADVILAMTDPPFEGIVGAWVALLKRRPFGYNIRDLYPDMALGGGIIPAGRAARIWERLHRWALRRARRVIVLGEDMRERIIGKGVDMRRVAIVRDGVEIPARQEPVDPAVISGIRGDARFIFLHAGNLGFYGAWQTLLDAARQVQDDGIDLVFVGEGAQQEVVRAAASGLKNVRFLGFFREEKIPSVLAAADAHVITVKRGLEGVVVPSKLYGILAAGKPVLAVATEGCDAARIVQDHHCGVAADPDDPAAVAHAMRHMARNPRVLSEMGERARAIAPEYDKVTHLSRFVQIIEETAAW
jgi:glycosyltransferase involved in cell wall biosynthesis